MEKYHYVYKNYQFNKRCKKHPNLDYYLGSGTVFKVALLKYGKKGKLSTRFGKTFTDEQKKKISDTIKNALRVICPHCGKEGAISSMKQWHFDNCKFKKD